MKRVGDYGCCFEFCDPGFKWVFVYFFVHLLIDYGFSLKKLKFRIVLMGLCFAAKRK